MAEEFLRNLPQVGEAELPDGKQCGICQEKYGKVDLHAGAMDVPVRLPCQHIVGSDCIRKWVSPDEHGKNTCPFCRSVFFAVSSELQELHDLNNQRIEALYRATLQPPGMTELDRQVARQFLSLGERFLYSELRGAGAPLPALSEDQALSAEQERALFVELMRMGAFRDLVGPYMTLREYRIVWRLLRRDGFVYMPNNPTMDGASGWLTQIHDSWFFVPSDEAGWPCGYGSLVGDFEQD